MTAALVNGAPMTILYGVKDSSMTAPTAVPDVLPSHLPKVLLFAKKGPVEPQLAVGASAANMFGAETFDLRSPYATHQTVLANFLNKQANAMMIQRLKPHDCGPRASIRIYLDVLPCTVPEYKRGTDGKIMKDTNGDAIPTGSMIDGFKVKWIAQPISVLDVGIVDPDNYDFTVTEDTDGYIDAHGVAHGSKTLEIGQATQQVGTMTFTDAAGNTVQSTMYPIMDIAAPYFGADGNNYGIRMWAPTVDSVNPIVTTLLTQNMVYPFRMACVYKNTVTKTSTIVQTLDGSQFVDICFKEGTINKSLETQVYIDDVFLDAYQSFDDISVIPTYGPFGTLHVYQDNIDTLVSEFYAKELPYAATGFTDFDKSVGEQYRFNFLSGVSSQNIPYHSFQVVYSDADSIRLADTSTIYAKGGSDGTMNDDVLSLLAIDAMAPYADPNSVYMDTAKYPESIMYDTGFKLEAKYAMLQFISQRKDTFSTLATHTVGGKVLTAAEEYSLAVALSARAALYPESDYFGTGVMRALIMGRSGKLLNSQYKKTLPVLLEVAYKAAGYMGAGDGAWKENANFDHGDAAVLELFKDINVPFVGATVRNKSWTAGLNYVLSHGRRSHFFPALKTVYGGDSLHDTSVLNSFFTALVCCELEKVGERVWRFFSGESSMTPDQFIDAVNAKFTELSKDRFAKRVTIIPDAQITAYDEKCGYSWTMRVKVYAPNMKTVENLYIEVFRDTALATTA